MRQTAMSPFRLLLGSLLLVGCAERGTPRTVYAAGPEARAQRVDSYLFHQATAHDLDLAFIGPKEGRLKVHVMGGSAVQELERTPEGRTVLRTSARRIELEDGEGARLLAEAADGRWVARAPVSPAAAASLAFLVAVDLDLAVQGASMVFEGKLYARCTLECATGVVCLRRSAFEECAEHVAVCGACLEQEP
jgi:hypothetical protein